MVFFKNNIKNNSSKINDFTISRLTLNENKDVLFYFEFPAIFILHDLISDDFFVSYWIEKKEFMLLKTNKDLIKNYKNKIIGLRDFLNNTTLIAKYYEEKNCVMFEDLDDNKANKVINLIKEEVFHKE